MTFCPSCGAEKKEGSKYCHNCGYEFKAVDSSATQDSIPNAELNQNPNPAVETSENSHTISKVLGYIFAILIPLIGLIFGIYLWVCDEEDAKKHGKIIIGISVVIWILSFIFMSSY
ncbi:MAG: zinc-ribbon domain-containing protein [Methanobrevibacter sp.]|nr:zinc-ribbon domain-containing protein [Methanobrevibacter sp.]